MFNTPNSGPLAPIVGLERRALEQAGVAPGQEQMAAASKGIPLSSDLAQLIQLNRVLQQRGAAQQQANPTPSTVAQDLKQMAMQQMQQQMPPQMPAREQGIARLPVGDLGVRGMADGGIVAFAEGGSPYEFNMIEDAEEQRRKKAAEAIKALVAQQAAKSPTVEQAVKRGAQPGGGLAEFVPTLTGGAGRISEYDRLLKDMQISNTYTLAERAKEREALEKQYGLDKIRAAREAEMARREKELSPEAQRKAFLNNLSAKLASQIGQRGVSTSTRLAQMLGAYGSTKAETAEQFKKATQDLNQAKLDVQEKNAIAQMTGALSDRKAAEDAQKQYADALKEKAKLDREIAQDQATAAYRADTLKQGSRELELKAARDQAEAAHQKAMEEIQSGKNPITKARDLLNSYTDQLKSLATILRDADPVQKPGLIQQYGDIQRRLQQVQLFLGSDMPGGGQNTNSASTGGSSLIDPSLIAAEKKRRGL